MLSSGTESAAPSQSMWPLFCHEIGLSYDQEEKLRAYQRVLLQDHESWLHRHTSFASRRVMQSAHDAVQALTLRAGQRERSSFQVLSPVQRLKMMAWSTQNRHRVALSTAAVDPPAPPPRDIAPKQQHVAANLYILNERVEQVLQIVHRAPPLVTGAALKKLSHRPSFEPLGASDEKGDPLSRDGSFASSGSLKRDASEMSMDCDESSSQHDHKPQIPSISPVDAQASAVDAIQQALGFVQDLLPPAPAVTENSTLEEASTFISFETPTPVCVPSLVYQASASYTQSAPSFGALQPPTQHERKSSFLPAHLNVVPEEMWPADEADEFLLDMIEGDWAIGEEIDMDMHA